jgi:hypothetical protein
MWGGPPGLRLTSGQPSTGARIFFNQFLLCHLEELAAWLRLLEQGGVAQLAFLPRLRVSLLVP